MGTVHTWFSNFLNRHRVLITRSLLLSVFWFMIMVGGLFTISSLPSDTLTYILSLTYLAPFVFLACVATGYTVKQGDVSWKFFLGIPITTYLIVVTIQSYTLFLAVTILNTLNGATYGFTEVLAGPLILSLYSVILSFPLLVWVVPVSSLGLYIGSKNPFGLRQKAKPIIRTARDGGDERILVFETELSFRNLGISTILFFSILHGTIYVLFQTTSMDTDLEIILFLLAATLVLVLSSLVTYLSYCGFRKTQPG